MALFEAVFMFLGASVCHQLPERSYFLGDVQMPLCARCIGIHFGFLLSVAFLMLGPKRFMSGLPTTKQLIVLGAIMMFFLIDAGLSYSGMSPSDNLRRTLSGLALGIPLPFVLIPFVNHLAFPDRKRSRVLERRSDWAWVAVLYALGAALILSAEESAAIFYVVSALGVAGVLLFYSTGMSLIVLLAAERSPLRTRDKVAIATALAIVSLLALAMVHDTYFPSV